MSASTARRARRLQLGGTLSYISNEDKYAQTLGRQRGPGQCRNCWRVTGGLPDIVFRRMELRLFGNYAFSDKSTVRFDAAYQRLTYDDWGYAFGGTPFLYSDNSTV